jgi:hypothetical protein
MYDLDRDKFLHDDDDDDVAFDRRAHCGRGALIAAIDFMA